MDKKTIVIEGPIYRGRVNLEWEHALARHADIDLRIVLVPGLTVIDDLGELGRAIFEGRHVKITFEVE